MDLPLYDDHYTNYTLGYKLILSKIRCSVYQFNDLAYTTCLAKRPNKHLSDFIFFAMVCAYLYQCDSDLLSSFQTWDELSINMNFNLIPYTSLYHTKAEHNLK